MICVSPGQKPLSAKHYSSSRHLFFFSKSYSTLAPLPKTKWDAGKQDGSTLQEILLGEINPAICCCVKIKEHHNSGKLYTVSGWNNSLLHRIKYNSKHIVPSGLNVWDLGFTTQSLSASSQLWCRIQIQVVSPTTLPKQKYFPTCGCTIWAQYSRTIFPCPI